jgi:hypothetical protein
MQATREECIFAHRAELPRQKAQDQNIERDKAHDYSASDLLPPIAAAKRARHRLLATYEVCFPRQALHKNQRPGKPAGLIAATRKPAHMPALAPGSAMAMPTPGSGPRCPDIVASAPQRQIVAKLCVAVTGIRLTPYDLLIAPKSHGINARQLQSRTHVISPAPNHALTRAA